MNEDILIQREYLEKAMELHRRYPVADAHLDLAGEVLLRSKLGEKEIINNRYLDNWKKAGLNLVMSSVYVPSVVLAEKGTEGAWEDAIAQIEALKREAAYLSEICMIKNKEDLEQAIREEKIGILLYMEGLDCIGGKVERLEELYQRGVRGASLTWSRQNMLATGCCKAGEYRQISGGLTDFGKRVVQELERQQMFIDVSHLNDDGFADVAGLTEKPFLATHSCARAVYDNYRNLTEEQIDTIAKKGGVIGLNGCKLIAGSLSGNHLEMLCKHAEYEIGRAGKHVVGFGFDLCDSYDSAYDAWYLPGIKKEKVRYDCLSDHSGILQLTAALLQRGMEEETVIGIMGGNLIAYLKKVLPPG